MTEPCTSENCHAWRTYGFAHTHPSDTAAGPRALISRLEQLNDDGTPAPPTQEDRDVSQAEPVSTRRGRFDVSPVPETQRHVLPNYMQQSEVGNAYMLALQAELEDLERTDPQVARASQRLSAATERLTRNIHQVYVSSKTLRCTKSCGGPAPHLDEYRAADVRPPAEQTARNNAADANKLPSSNKN